MKKLSLFALLILSACGGDRGAGPGSVPVPPTPPTAEKATGTLGGKNWSFSSAVAFPREEGWDVFIAGPDETLDCAKRPAKQTHLYFVSRARLGTFTYSSSSHTSVDIPLRAKVKNPTSSFLEEVFPTNSEIVLATASKEILAGSVKFFSDRELGGTIEGAFTAQVCTASEHLNRLPKIWQGNGTLGQPGREESVQLEFTYGISKMPNSESERLTIKLVNVQTERPLLIFNNFIINDSGIYQDCFDRGLILAGRIIPSIGLYTMSILPTCVDTPNKTYLEFQVRDFSMKLQGRLVTPDGLSQFLAEPMLPRLGQ